MSTPKQLEELASWHDQQAEGAGNPFAEWHVGAAVAIRGAMGEIERLRMPSVYWDTDDYDGENGSDDLTVILDSYGPGEVIEVVCARNLPNQWGVGYITDTGGFRAQAFATEAEAVAFAALNQKGPQDAG